MEREPGLHRQDYRVGPGGTYPVVAEGGPVRTRLIALTMVLGIAATASAQSRVVVTDVDGASRAEMRAATAPYATGEPQATIQARALKTGVDPTVADFRIRSWDEGEGVRVLVFAVIP